MRILQMILILGMSVSCGSGRTETPQTQNAPGRQDSDAGGQGSCTFPDPTLRDATICHESTSKHARDVCAGSWKSQPCDAKMYAFRCQYEVQRSVNGGPRTTIRETRYLMSGSTLACAGRRSSTSDSASLYPVTPLGKPLLPGIQIMDQDAISAIVDKSSIQEPATDKELVWGGVVSSKSGVFEGPVFKIPFKDAASLRFEILALGAPEPCLKALGMGLEYRAAGIFGGPMHSPYSVSGGWLMQNKGEFPSQWKSPAVSGIHEIRGLVDFDADDPVGQDCPFVASFRINVKKDI